MRQQGVKKIILWVDAISIDQNSVDEKNHQVQVMGQIYRNAERVYAWLGQHDNKTEYLLWLFAQFPDDQSAEPTEVLYLPPRYSFGRCLDSALFYASENFWLNLAQQFRSNPYWRRIWTLPEQFLAQELVYILNTQWCPVERFVYYLGEFKILPNTFREVDMLFEELGRNFYLKRIKHSKGPVRNIYLGLTIAGSFKLWCGLEASVAMNKVYALFGLLEGDHGCAVQVDYSCDKATLLLRLLHSKHLGFYDMPRYIHHLQLLLADVDLPAFAEEVETAVYSYKLEKLYAYSLYETVDVVQQTSWKPMASEPKDTGWAPEYSPAMTPIYLLNARPTHRPTRCLFAAYRVGLGDANFLDPQSDSRIHFAFASEHDDGPYIILSLELPANIQNILQVGELKLIEDLGRCLRQLSEYTGSFLISSFVYPSPLIRAPFKLLVEFWIRFLALHNAVKAAKENLSEQDLVLPRTEVD